MHCFSFRSFSFPLLSSLNAPRFGLIIHRSSSFQLKWKWKWKKKNYTHSNAVRVCNLLLPRSIHISFHIFHHTNLTRLKEHDPYFQWLCILCILDFNAYIFHFLDVYLFMLLTLLLLFYFLFFHLLLLFQLQPLLQNVFIHSVCSKIYGISKESITFARNSLFIFSEMNHYFHEAINSTINILL